MAIISIIGKVDKRILVLPIIRACSIDGATAVFSDDGNFKNLYHETENEGTVSGVDIFIKNSLSDSMPDNVEYKHLVYVYSDLIDINNKVDLTISCKCYDRSFVGKSITKTYEDLNKVDVIFSSIPLKNVKNVIVLKPEYYRYLIETEEKKELLINRDKTLCKLITFLLSSLFDMSNLQFSKLLVRKKYELSMK